MTRPPTRSTKRYVTYADLERGRPVDYDKVGKVSSGSVLKHTGKGWKQWIEILEKAGAATWTHREIATYLKKKHRLTPWWQQGVAVGFEIAVGKRLAGQDARGKYMVTATKSLAFSVQAVWKALLSVKGQEIWLKPLSEVEIRPKAQFETSDGFFGEVRTIARSRRLRLFWQDPLWEKHTVVELLLVPRPKERSILVFNHTGIADTRTQGLLRKRWRSAADQVSVLLSPTEG